VMAEHQGIFDALARRDPDASEAAMRLHVRRSVEWLRHEADLLERSSRAGDDRTASFPAIELTNAFTKRA
jgi:DNA-binding GntR family transcriptional regulator